MKTIAMGFGMALLGLSFAWAQPAAAQGYLMPDTPKKGFWVETMRPDVKLFDVTIPSTAWYVSGRYPLAERVWGVAEIPFAYGDLDVSGSSEMSGRGVFGNPYVGVELAATGQITLELGARAPLTSADDESFGDVVGMLADMMRFEAFAVDVVPVSAAASFRQTLSSGLNVGARAGVTSMFWTGDDDVGETTTFLDYGVFGHYPVNMARFGAGVAGRWDLTEDYGDFSDNSLHHLGLSADYMFRRVRPGLEVRIPLDKDYRDLISSSVGLYVQVPLR